VYVLDVVPDVGDVAELELSAALRLAGAEPEVHVPPGLHLEMKAQLIVELAIHPRG
jgi:hypothetical protein